MGVLVDLPEGPIGKVADQDPYLPFAAKLELGMIDRSAAVESVGDDLSTELMQGRLPHFNGIIALSGGKIGAIDFVAAENQPRSVYVRPTSKTAVSSAAGKMLTDGLAVLSSEDYMVRILALSVRPAQLSPWEMMRLGIEWRQYGVRERVGVPLWGMLSRQLKIWDYDPNTGEMLILPPKKLVAF